MPETEREWKWVCEDHPVPNYNPDTPTRHPNKPDHYISMREYLESLRADFHKRESREWKPIVVDGVAVRFPHVCGGCNRTTWHAPGDLFFDTLETYGCIVWAATSDDWENAGGDWWKALLEENSKQVRESWKATSLSTRTYSPEIQKQIEVFLEKSSELTGKETKST